MKNNGTSIISKGVVTVHLSGLGSVQAILARDHDGHAIFLYE